MKAISAYLWAWLLPLLGLAQGTDGSSCLRLNGLLIDQSTHQPLDNGQVFARMASGRIKIGTSDKAGKFSAIVPCEMVSLVIERSAYRSQSLTIQRHAIDSQKSVSVVIPLLMTDKQGSDRPYLQTEQTSYIQQTNSHAQTATTQQLTAFSVVDALDKKPLIATICLFFTKSGEKKCLTADSHGLVQLNLDDRDIIALEVAAAGYQAYAGNLIVNQLDGRSFRHEIQLQRELTLLTVQADKASQCAIRMGDRLVPLLPIPDQVGQFVVYTLIPGRYELLIATKTTMIRRFIQLQQGLNTEEIKSTTPVIATSKSDGAVRSVSIHTFSQPTLLLPDSIPMIYFEQGSYQLRMDSQEVLREVAAYLKTHPSFTLQIVGHTDNVGDERLNLNLSLDRAKVTSSFLIRQGIQESRLTQNGFGGKYPLVPNNMEANKALNRRVALTLVPAQ